ncbi:MAG: response regulator [Planctomycetes bacterium]|nr:response regulator [Planctomycetota bacterium]
MEPKTVLIADDETHVLHVLTLKLQSMGLNVLAAADGAEALELATTQRPDLIITDYQMPRLSGVELGAKLRNDPSTWDIPVILLTARGFGDRSTDPPDNIKWVVEKPFRLQALTDVVCAAIGDQAPALASADPAGSWFGHPSGQP